VPHDMPYCFQNVGDTSGRLLAICTPSCVERSPEGDSPRIEPLEPGHPTLAW
jgi:hypothetical protein